MEEFLRDLLHGRNEGNAHLLVRGHRLRGLAAACHHGTLLLRSLLQGKFSWFRPKSNSYESISIISLSHIHKNVITIGSPSYVQTLDSLHIGR
jgi:hypothetical protein